MKAIEQYFHVVLFIMLYKVVLTFKSVDETSLSNTVILLYKIVLAFKGCRRNPQFGISIKIELS